MGKNFRAMVVSEIGDNIFNRNIVTRNTDDLPTGDVLINVKYSSLNYKDALSARGHRGITRKYPHTPGVDAAGIVEESSNAAFKAGDAVIVTGYDLGMNTSGGFAEYIRMPAGWVVPLPPGLTLQESMIYGTAGFTAGMCIREFERHDIMPETGKILVTGATGGVGTMAVLMLSTAGYSVTASSGKPEKADYLKKLGADGIISREEAADATNRPLLSKSWAGVVENVGGNTLSTAIRSTQPWGIICSVGLVNSDKLEATVYPFILRGVGLIGIDSADRPMNQKLYIWSKIATDWKSDMINEIYKEVTLDELDNEIELILAGKQCGRVVVRL